MQALQKDSVCGEILGSHRSEYPQYRDNTYYLIGSALLSVSWAPRMLRTKEFKGGPSGRKGREFKDPSGGKSRARGVVNTPPGERGLC